MGWRQRLGLDARTPLIGIFGFLKPYKRIQQAAFAFRRLHRVNPQVRMILCGEAHPDLGLDQLLNQPSFMESTAVLGYQPEPAFTGYLAACDIILNLRYPTVGESSGTLLRAFSLGKAVLVSRVGSFLEYPDEICLKVPVDGREEDTLFEYLNLLVSRPEFAQEFGGRACEWVRRECLWDRCAALYLDFVKFVEQGGSGDWSAAPPSAPASEPPPAAAEPVPAGYLATWVTDPGAREYLEQHTDRFTKTLELTPAGGPGRRILEMGAYLQITPALRTKLGYEEVRGCYFGELGRVERKRVHSDSGEDFECEVAYFDAERDPYPYADEYFDTVLCCELLEHLKEDPMHLMAEINRILKPGGHLVLTTPNQASLRAISAILHGYHPGFFPAYLRNRDSGDARHAREYTAIETRMLLEESGFAVTRLETGPFRSAPRPELEWVITALRQFGMPEELRGDGTYIVGRKQGSVRMRHPAWLYA
jgi:SAM-dependent methyltransferase